MESQFLNSSILLFGSDFGFFSVVMNERGGDVC
jgi:hypothetical protein